MTSPHSESIDEGLFAALIGDGRALFKLEAIALVFAGLFVLFQAATGHFLPHDTAFLGMDAGELCPHYDCRVVHFMIHDRVSFGGVLIAIGVMYLWLAEFPLRDGQSWAWWALALSGGAGFLSFLAYLGYGYLDTWHGAATLGLIPIYISALWRTRGLRKQRTRPAPLDLRSRQGRGRALLIVSCFGLTAAGVTITTVGATSVFVPQDLEYIGASREAVGAIHPNLLPLIAHDRAGFGGALLSSGIAMLVSVLYGRPTRSLCQALVLAGAFGFATAIGIHPIIGYLSFTHLAPAVAGCGLFVLGVAFSFPRDGDRSPS